MTIRTQTRIFDLSSNSYFISGWPRYYSQMRILSIQLGAIETLEFRGKSMTTAINKKPVGHAVMLSRTGLVGDSVADPKNHGGEEKALYAYGEDAYKWWRENHPIHRYTLGAFGENLTLSTLDESAIRIGDIFEVGKATIQVTAPRIPCVKLSVKYQDSMMVKKFFQSRRPGIYFRVLCEGILRVGDTLNRIHGEKTGKLVSDIFLEIE